MEFHNGKRKNNGKTFGSPFRIDNKYVHGSTQTQRATELCAVDCICIESFCLCESLSLSPAKAHYRMDFVSKREYSRNHYGNSRAYVMIYMYVAFATHTLPNEKQREIRFTRSFVRWLACQLSLSQPHSLAVSLIPMTSTTHTAYGCTLACVLLAEHTKCSLCCNAASSLAPFTTIAAAAAILSFAAFVRLNVAHTKIKHKFIFVGKNADDPVDLNTHRWCIDMYVPYMHAMFLYAVMYIRCWTESYMYIPFRIFRLRHVVVFLFVFFSSSSFCCRAVVVVARIHFMIHTGCCRRIRCSRQLDEPPNWLLICVRSVEKLKLSKLQSEGIKRKQNHRLLTRLLTVAFIAVVVLIVVGANQRNLVFFITRLHRRELNRLNAMPCLIPVPF